MDHVFLTRFNLPSAGVESLVRARPGWLSERVELFERYCLPSVLSQTDRRSRWIIYFDPESPEWLRDRINRHYDAGYYVPIFRAEVSSAQLVADMSALVDSRGEELLTTNLDNDDGLAADFVERLCAQPAPRTVTAYYLTNGLIKSPGGLYRRRDPHNAFATVRESWEAPQTCWAAWHNRLGEHMPVVTIGGAPGWLQVVHGGNVSNRTRGRLVAPHGYHALFPGLLVDVMEPDTMAIVGDRLLDNPRRIGRDMGRYMAKTLAMKMLGPNGFERAKQWVRASGDRVNTGRGYR